jgi:hypothetical protein
MKKEAKAVKSFLDILDSTLPAKVGRYRQNKYDFDKIIDYMLKLSKKEAKALLSDSYWNRYPSYVSYPITRSRRAHGGVISTLVINGCEYVPELKELFMKHSDGLFLVATLDCLSGKDRQRVCLRAINSKDVRVRLRVAKNIDVRKAKRLMKDRSASVRNSIIKRIGIDNCATDLIDDADGWIRRQAISASDLSSSESNELISHYLNEEINGNNNHYTRWILCSLVKKLSDEDLLYRLDLGQNKKSNFNSNKLIEEYIRNRLFYANILTKGDSLND